MLGKMCKMVLMTMRNLVTEWKILNMRITLSTMRKSNATWLWGQYPIVWPFALSFWFALKVIQTVWYNHKNRKSTSKNNFPWHRNLKNLPRQGSFPEILNFTPMVMDAKVSSSILRRKVFEVASVYFLSAFDVGHNFLQIPLLKTHLKVPLLI